MEFNLTINTESEPLRAVLAISRYPGADPERVAFEGPRVAPRAYGDMDECRRQQVMAFMNCVSYAIQLAAFPKETGRFRKSNDCIVFDGYGA